MLVLLVVIDWVLLRYDWVWTEEEDGCKAVGMCAPIINTFAFKIVSYFFM